jgi:protoporphyrinogen oxidase
MTDMVVIGGGPSGLAAALEAVGNGASVVVLERFAEVGGLARTIPFQGSRFDIGPHRFFTRNAEVGRLVARVLGDDLIPVPRLTRILHDGVFFDYPLTPLNAMKGVGPAKAAGFAGSYAAARLRGALSAPPLENFEDWIVDRFGRRLFENFFKTYTEKVWGISCRRISADWAAQRIKGLSLATALRAALLGSSGAGPKTLVEEFVYPRFGAGETYERMAALVAGAGGTVTTGATVSRLRRDGARIRAAVVAGPDGVRHEIAGERFLSSATLTDTIAMMDPPPPPEVLRASAALRYRDHLAVNLVVAGPLFPDNWIYVHSRAVALARVANYRNFSLAMAAAPEVSPVTAEYFAFPGDPLSIATDDQLVARATDELRQIGLLRQEPVLGAFVVRSRDAYPVIEIGHERHVATIRAWLAGIENLMPIGRAGMFKYNNQDHAIATGLLAARTALGLGRFDPWRVNIDAEYHEDGPAAGDR